MTSDEQPREDAIKTDEKKQHFDDIYVQSDPVAFKEKIINELDYVSDNFNRETFNRLILPWTEKRSSAGKTIHYTDLCCSFGNTTLAILHKMTTDEIRSNWRDAETSATIQKPRRAGFHTTGIDISENALSYGKAAGIFDQTIQADLNALSGKKETEIEQTMEKSDLLVSTASLVYLELSTIEKLIAAFAKPKREGFVLVNFLAPFSPEKADATKRILLNHLEFVGSTASRHRLLSPLERENYPDEKWSLLELWVLRRKS